jgi:diguanylate cyclase (GGDEF)-like protein/PAS domain S-box-containing protein
MTRRRRYVWPAIAVLAFAAVAALRAGGHLEFIEREAVEARARLLQREVDSDIVIVGIDAVSLAELDTWPWPRRHHARLIERLAVAGPRHVFVDIDFSSPSREADDARLEAALDAWTGAPIILPAFLQQASGADTGAVLRRPLDRFARHAMLASANQLLDADSLVRRFRPTWRDGQHELPSVVRLLNPSLQDGPDLPIDYSIALSSFSYVSYADLLAGRVDAGELRGRTVFVGATAIELNDILAAPVYRALPGVVVQALALETARQGIARSPPQWFQLATLAALAALTAAMSRSLDWRWSLAGVMAILASQGAVFVLAYSWTRLSIHFAAPALVTIAVFLAGALRSLDEQTLRALSYALGLRRRDALLKSVVDSSADAILCVDARGGVQIANPSAARLFDFHAGRLVGAPFGELVPKLRGQPLAALAASVMESEGMTRTGSVFPVELTVSRVLLADEELYTVIARDISERLAQQRELEYRATHDALTTLPNRSALVSHIEGVLRDCTVGSPAALLMLDLCRFKEVNDTLGHDTGDRILQEVAHRFRAVIADQGLLARIGGDEFTAMLPVCDDAAAAGVAQMLVDALRTPIDIHGVAIDMGVSIGIARAPRDARDAWTLLQRADVAMYVAKRGLASSEFYDEARDAHSVRRLGMVANLRAAIGTPDLQLKYQPKVNLRTRRVESVEALLRWQHSVLGAVGPAEFMPLAESTDLVRPLTEWTIVEALAQAGRWRAQGLSLRVAVNLSARLLQDAAFPARLKNLLATCGELPGSLELEITESAMMIDLPRALRTIREISELGVPIAIDDYGTGFSSLGYLRDLTVHALKLDKSFVTELQTREDNRVIVASTVAMAHALALEVVAEGVETEWAAVHLAEAGCDHAQGYLYSPALPADECLAWIRRFNAGAGPLSCGAIIDGDGATADKGAA